MREESQNHRMALFGRDVKDDLIPTFHCRSGSSTSSLALKLCMGQQVIFDLPGQVPLTAARQGPALLLWGSWRCDSSRLEGWEEDLPKEWCAQHGGCSMEAWGCMSCQEPVWPLPLFK